MRDIKVSYQRNLKSNWLIFEPQDRFLMDIKNKYAFEIGMIENNNIRNFLRPEIKRADGGVGIYYDISSLQPFLRVLEVKSIEGEKIKDLILEIISAAKSLEEFLLDASSIVLDPEYIFTDLDFKKIYFIYMPRSESNGEEIKNLLEYISNNICKDDKDSLMMVYSMLQESRKKDFIISDLEKILDVQKNSRDIKPDNSLEEESALGDRKFITDKENTKKQSGIFGNLFKMGKAKNKEEDSEDEFFEKLFEGYEPENKELCLNEEKNEFNFNESVSNTVLLTETKPGTGGRWLRDLKGRDDICISYLPFIIGKQERISDFVLDVEGVSRMHLQFFEKEGELYAKDLNSRNGSSVNGKQMENEEDVKLYNGDLINICGASFRLEIN